MPTLLLLSSSTQAEGTGWASLQLLSHHAHQAVKPVSLLSPLSCQARQADNPLEPVEPKPLELFKPVEPVAPVDVVLSLIGRQHDNRLGSQFGGRRGLEVGEAIVVV
jgi:hypothetical protein